MLLSLSPVHMSEEYYERPKEMIPERWLRDSDIQHLQDNGEVVENVRKADPLNMFAFGFGSRPCFGRKFALMQIKAVLYVFFQVINHSLTLTLTLILTLIQFDFD